jgi:predicted N-acyltransferase
MIAEFHKTFSDIPQHAWDELNTSSNPFLSYQFMEALELSKSASLSQGWQPHHLTIKENNAIEALLPLYLKSHSWGEYVFDWDWARAYEEHNLEYYPKLVSTIPFTPVSSNKLISQRLSHQDVLQPLIEYCNEYNIASWHLLFCPKIDVLPNNVFERNTVQFHWFNKGYASFDDYLSTFTARKRKNTRKERASIKKQNLNVRQVSGHDITKEELHFFYLTYQLTYLKRQHTPHLSIEFFEQVVKTMPDNILLIIAEHEGNDVACALFFHDDKQLYGRYWGSTESFSNLHFELCYYQGIEFCIKNNIQSFNPGTQGEHKIQRGFEPVLTYSYHWVKHTEFRLAIKDFCKREQMHTINYQQQCALSLPFKNNQDAKNDN